MSDTMWIILFGALATYLTRIGGHVVLSRFKRIHPRVQAGLNAVPAAVLTTLVAPATFNAGPAEWAAILVSAAVYWMRGLMAGLAVGVIVLVTLRNAFGF
ncbi:MAG: AzlD family protein [Notoacmeibacter sp.]|nr:AzlD family protein [Notoacmeibacter sp.]MCC0032061.1 AzlD family protein [Brucellaceae bacterium]